MFYIQGYQDNNVDTQMSNGFLEAVKRTGVPLKIWQGQWQHSYPQGDAAAPCALGAACRGDFWEQGLVAWFDRWLLGRDTGIMDTPLMQTQADDGVWRHEAAWPPAGVAPRAFYPGPGGTLGTTGRSLPCPRMRATSASSSAEEVDIRTVQDPSGEADAAPPPRAQTTSRSRAMAIRGAVTFGGGP